MKTRIMIKNLGLGLVTMFLMMLSFTGYSQPCTGSSVGITLGNFSQTPTTVEFDVFLTNANLSIPIRLSTASINVLHSASMLPAGATGTVTIAQQPADCDFPGYPTHLTESPISYDPAKRSIRILGNPFASGNQMLTATPKRYCRMRLTSSLPWTEAVNATFNINPSNLTSPIRQASQVTMYCNGNPNSSTITNTSLVIGGPYAYTIGQVCATSGNALTTPVTCFGGSDGSATITMSPVPSTAAISYTVDGGASQNATLVGGAFTVSGLTAGSRSIVVSNAGCSNVTVSATVGGPTAPLTNSTSITACDSYTWSVNGQTYTASGTYTGTSTNGSGCTVNETLILTINPNGGSTTNITACDSYLWPQNGQTYTASGTYTATGTTPLGCPDNHTLVLTINNSTTTTESQTACDSYTWPVNGQTYTTSGTYSASAGLNASGCPITSTLVLTINASANSTQTVTACDTYFWNQNGQTYTASGTYTATGTTAAGCADNHTLILTINNSTSSSQSVTACDTYTWSENNQTYTASGTYTATGTNAAGCVDTKTLVLTINNSTSSSQSVTACDTYTWSENNQTYTASGTYTATGTNAAGCPETKTLVLTINNSTSSSESQTACGSYLWPVNGQTYTASGTYTSTSTNAAGCPDTKTLVLTINSSAISTQPADTNICSVVGSTASISVATPIVGATYTWQFRVVTTTATGPWNTISISNAGTTYTGYTTATLGITRSSTLVPAKGIEYRVTINGGPCGPVTSATAKLNILGAVKAGLIANPTSVCLGNDLTFTLSGFIGTSFQWQSAPSNSVAAPGVFTDIPGATSSTYTIVGATAAINKAYRVVVTNGPCGGTTATSSVKSIKVDPTTVPGTSTGGGTVCSGGSGTLRVTGHVGRVQWEYSTDGGTTYTNAPKASAIPPGLPFATTSASSASTSYIVTNITAPLHFRARVTSGACLVEYSNVLTFVLGTQAQVGTVSAVTSTLCPGTGTTLNLSGPNVGVIAWQRSTNFATANPTWLNILNSNSTVRPTGNLTLSTAYRAVVTIGSCSTVISNVQIVTVVAKPVSKTITGNVTSPTGGSATAALCTTNASKILTIGAGSTGAIQWQTSITSTTAGFVDIPGATGQSYTVTNPQVGPNYFRATFTNSCGVVVTGTAFTVHYKSCREAAPATIGSSATLGKEFGVVAFPNPYTNNFNLSLTSSSDAMIQVSVYDMTGRMLEQREVSPSQVGEQEIGQTYPTGVYNVIVTQGEEVKTLRVIKR
jgi:hypothetical protein